MWVDRIGTMFGGFRQFGVLSGGLQRPLVVVIPKSNDQFMERPPIKIVQQRAYMGTALHSMR
jgi:hypothetical protein